MHRSFQGLLGVTALACLTTASAGAQPRLVISVATHRPEFVGQCFATEVRKVETRLVDNGQEIPGSGSEIELADGHVNTDYDQLPGIDRSRPGDPVRLCVISLPRRCPKGDTRGIRYRGRNLRTGLGWVAMDSEHMCGGA
jgi:hypothetical protein